MLPLKSLQGSIVVLQNGQTAFGWSDAASGLVSRRIHL